MKPSRIAAAAALSLLAAACASGGPGDGLGLRKLSWFSYLNADDLKAVCKAGSPERVRLVLNADYAEHVRTYDLAVDDATGGGELVIRALPAANLADLNSGDVLGAWRGSRAVVKLTPKQTTALQGRITRSGAFEPLAAPLALKSADFWWLVSGCHEGKGFVSAFPLAGGTEPPAFAAALKTLDKTGVAFPDLASRNRQAARQPPRHPQDIDLSFTIRIGENGLSGLLPH
ncbi:MAG: hypothetical protein WCJ64_22045 [Rhodospirillaceae bacterium]